MRFDAGRERIENIGDPGQGNLDDNWERREKCKSVTRLRGEEPLIRRKGNNGDLDQRPAYASTAVSRSLCGGLNTNTCKHADTYRTHHTPQKFIQTLTLSLSHTRARASKNLHAHARAHTHTHKHTHTHTHTIQAKISAGAPLRLADVQAMKTTYGFIYEV